jgi:hypothetical protein
VHVSFPGNDEIDLEGVMRIVDSFGKNSNEQNVLWHEPVSVHVFFYLEWVKSVLFSEYEVEYVYQCSLHRSFPLTYLTWKSIRCD